MEIFDLELDVVAGSNHAFIGEGGNIVTHRGTPTKKRLYVINTINNTLYTTAESNNVGEYCIVLDPTNKYMIIARDETGQCEPVGIDNITPEEYDFSIIDKLRSLNV